MPVVVEIVPGLLHVSLFLFFVGLGDFNMAVGVSTTFPIGINDLLYIFTFASVIYSQSPNQNSSLGLIRYLMQRTHGQTYKDRGLDGGSKSVSADMSKGQMQLAMGREGERMTRDQGARCN